MVVVSTTPALEGMRVDATPDPLLRSRLIDEARGHGGAMILLAGHRQRRTC